MDRDKQDARRRAFTKNLMTSSWVETGPRRLDMHQAAKVKDRTLKEYRRASAPFVAFLRRRGLAPNRAEEFDDALVEWKNAEVVSRHNFTLCVACLEFFYPRFGRQTGLGSFGGIWVGDGGGRETYHADVQRTCAFSSRLLCQLGPLPPRLWRLAPTGPRHQTK